METVHCEFPMVYHPFPHEHRKKLGYPSFSGGMMNQREQFNLQVCLYHIPSCNVTSLLKMAIEIVNFPLEMLTFHSSVNASLSEII